MFSIVTEMNGQLFMLTCTGNNRRIIDVSVCKLYASIDEANCTKDQVMKALLGFHCFTGCDTVSSFARREKLKPLKLLFKRSEYIDAFCSLGEDANLDSDTTKKLERFTLHMYGQPPPFPSMTCGTVFIVQKKEMRRLILLPLCLDVFTHHCMRTIKRTSGDNPSIA